jgi:hydrogenase-4 membrane subunit HyfE
MITLLYPIFLTSSEVLKKFHGYCTSHVSFWLTAMPLHPGPVGSRIPLPRFLVEILAALEAAEDVVIYSLRVMSFIEV